MTNEKLLIQIEIYIYYGRRAKIYSPSFLKGFYKHTALTRDQYSDYLRALQIVAKTVEEMGYEDKVTFHVRNWLVWFWRPFLKKAFHSPVIIIGGEVVSEGIVPNPDLIKETITKTDRKYKFLDKR